MDIFGGATIRVNPAKSAASGTVLTLHDFMAQAKASGASHFMTTGVICQAMKQNLGFYCCDITRLMRKRFDAAARSDRMIGAPGCSIRPLLPKP